MGTNQGRAHLSQINETATAFIKDLQREGKCGVRGKWGPELLPLNGSVAITTGGVQMRLLIWPDRPVVGRTEPEDAFKRWAQAVSAGVARDARDT